MLERFFRIQVELSAVSDLIPLIPTLVECSLLTRGFEHLERFHAVTIMLQKEVIRTSYVFEKYSTKSLKIIQN